MLVEAMHVEAMLAAAHQVVAAAADVRGNQPGGQGAGGRRDRPVHTKTVVVTSKKPKANITAAMKEGEEPLRSFSDLMQFYEAKRTDDSSK